MRARGESVGIISVFGVHDHLFRPEDGALLASVAGHAGVAVQNALLQRQAERAAAQEERRRMAQEIHDSVTQSIFSLIFTIGAARKSAELRDFDHMAETLEEIRGHRAAGAQGPPAPVCINFARRCSSTRDFPRRSAIALTRSRAGRASRRSLSPRPSWICRRQPKKTSTGSRSRR